MKKIILSIVAVFIVVATAQAKQQVEPNSKPFVIPELEQWSGSTGTYSPGKNLNIAVKIAERAALMPIAQALAEDASTLFEGKSAAKLVENTTAGNITLTIGGDISLGKEGYEISIMPGGIEVRALTPTGVFWATRTLLQIMEQDPIDHTLPCGEIVDRPKYAVRGFMLDCGRKFIPIKFLRDYVKFMSYYKMNTFQIHLNDNGFIDGKDSWNDVYSAFRLESETYPGLTAKDGFYTKKEFIDLQILAEKMNVNIIPEIDAPAHALAFSKYLPEIGSEKYGIDHLDLFNPKTYDFMDGLYKEYLSGSSPVFRGRQVHIGTDEYSNKDSVVVEKFRYFTDRYIKYVESFGKQAVVWGALTHAKGATPVKVDNVLMYAWYNGYADPKEMQKLGYKMISIPDGLTYIVPEAGYYHDYLNTESLYQNWEPRFVGKVEFEDGDSSILGGMFALWNDHVGNGVTTADIHHRVVPAMQTLSQKMWNGSRERIPYGEFNKKREILSEAPGINLLARADKDRKGIVMDVTSVKQGSELPIAEIGFNYRVSFELNLKSVTAGDTLFYSPNVVLYAQMPDGKGFGWHCEEYNRYFNYSIPAKRKVSVSIEGNNRETVLYVDGKEHQRLAVGRTKTGRFNIADLKTLVFPLTPGNFKGKMTNLVVEVL